MLLSLEIKDYALIENLEVEFTPGLNIITGETGAGKSILIDAMGLLLGNRASTQVVRKDAKKSIIEAIFDVANNKKVDKLLQEHNIEKEDELIVRREISVKGSNRCFVNDTPVQLSMIQSLGNLLIDLHGQHDHQSLLKSNTHIELVDEFAGHDELLNKYKFNYARIAGLTKDLFEMRNKEQNLKDEKEAFEFQLKEIESVSPQPGEEEELTDQLNILENSERLMQLTSEICDMAYDSESSAHNLLVDISNLLDELNEIDPKFEEKATELKSTIEIVNDVSKAIRSYSDRIDLESGTLEEVRERLGSLSLLKKRYGGSIEKIIEHRDMLLKELEIAHNYDEKIKELQTELEEQRKITGEIAGQLSESRRKTSALIEQDVVTVLNELGITDAQFKVNFKSSKAPEGGLNYVIVDNEKFKFNSSGIDEVEFLISMNLGEDLKPLTKVASGGEISRVMLALKSCLAKTDKLPLLIFDEIDTGVSGRIAQKVGTALHELSMYHQIISITHLPQIAGLADSHYAVQKIQLGSRVVSTIKKLDDNERVREVAKLIAGEEVTEASLKSAKELIADKQ